MLVASLARAVSCVTLFSSQEVGRKWNGPLPGHKMEASILCCAELFDGISLRIPSSFWAVVTGGVVKRSGMGVATSRPRTRSGGKQAPGEDVRNGRIVVDIAKMAGKLLQGLWIMESPSVPRTRRPMNQAHTRTIRRAMNHDTDIMVDTIHRQDLGQIQFCPLAYVRTYVLYSTTKWYYVNTVLLRIHRMQQHNTYVVRLLVIL